MSADLDDPLREVALYEVRRAEPEQARILQVEVHLHSGAQGTSSPFRISARDIEDVVSTSRHLLATASSPWGITTTLGGMRDSTRLTLGAVQIAWTFAIAQSAAMPMWRLLTDRQENDESRLFFYATSLGSTPIAPSALESVAEAGYGAVKIECGVQPPVSVPFAVDCRGTATYNQALTRYERERATLLWIEDPIDYESAKAAPGIAAVTGEAVVSWPSEVIAASYELPLHWLQVEPSRCGLTDAVSVASQAAQHGVPLLLHGHQPYAAVHIAAAASCASWIEINLRWIADRFDLAPVSRNGLREIRLDLLDALTRPGGGPSGRARSNGSRPIVLTQ